ncbi:efflux RND transporter periplasmic adaptor subunit [Tundrisphaera sp. TA3]|uniref:efflux RND transporter periplasmic adaptor subunit n=1 Tax=Tundrisphaera sp. TA3 TaxID=3435775 RepID=UPI003EBB3F97
MRLALAAARPSSAIPSSRWIVAFAVGAVALAAASHLAHDRLFHEHASAGAGAKAGEEPASAVAEAPAHDPAATVTLPEGKFKLADIRVEPASAVALPSEVSVAGRIDADPYHRVDVRPKAAGVVRTLAARPGQKVKAGDVLVVLDSPDVGTARLAVRARQRELATVRVEADWKARVADNVASLIDRLRKGAPADEMSREFADKPLGNSRGILLAAYSEMEIASHEAGKLADLNKKKVVGEHPVFVAQHTFEGAQAKFAAAMEQVRFDVSQQDRVAKQAVRTAEEAVVDAAQRLRILGVEEDLADLLAHPERASALPSGTEDVTAYPVVAPFDGTVVTTSTVVSQHVGPADILCLVADLSTVLAVANVPESYFPLLPSLGQGTVRLTAEAYPGRDFEAKVLYVGSEVDPNTRTVRLVAETKNPDDLLKLGMFATIVLDSAASEPSVTVPAASVIEIDEKPAVFVPAKGERSFQLHPVTLGREANGLRVVASGLKAGDPVVTSGAFLIKSELILQNESEED